MTLNAYAAFLSPSELLLSGLGAIPDDSPLHAWGAPALSRTGCLCLRLPRREPGEAIAGRWGSGVIVSSFPDLNLRLAELLAEMQMPASLLGPVLASATLDFVNTAVSRDEDDSRGLVEFVQALDSQRLEQYLALLTTDGPLVPMEDAPEPGADHAGAAVKADRGRRAGAGRNDPAERRPGAHRVDHRPAEGDGGQRPDAHHGGGLQGRCRQDRQRVRRMGGWCAPSERPPFGCTWDPGTVVRGHHVRVVATLADGTQLTDNVRTKDLGYTERAHVDAVLVPIIVTDHGRFVRGLQRGDFEVLEDGVPQQLVAFASEDSPLDLVLAIDVSGSMEKALDDVKDAVKQLLSKLRPGDAATLIGFNETTFLVAEREKDQRAREDAVGLLTAWGGTALYDATVRAVDLVGRTPGRKGVILFSDGDDRHSLTPPEVAAARVQSGNAMLYSIGFGSGASVPALRARLEHVRPVHGRPRILPAAHRGARSGLR